MLWLCRESMERNSGFSCFSRNEKIEICRFNLRPLDFSSKSMENIGPEIKFHEIHHTDQKSSSFLHFGPIMGRREFPPQRSFKLRRAWESSIRQSGTHYRARSYRRSEADDIFHDPEHCVRLCGDAARRHCVLVQSLANSADGHLFTNVACCRLLLVRPDNSHVIFVHRLADPMAEVVSNSSVDVGDLIAVVQKCESPLKSMNLQDGAGISSMAHLPGQNRRSRSHTPKNS